MKVLEAREVTKTFDEGASRVEVLKGVSLDVARGEVVALEGPSGSGKTTLLSILGCILTPTSGEVVVAGERARSDRPEALRDIRRRSIGFVFQQYNLFPALSALENVEYSLNVKGVRGDEAHREATRVLERVGLADRLHFLPRDLSGGQKQRVAIARSLVLEPTLLLLDEPASGLNTAETEAFAEVLLEVRERFRLTILLVEHDMGLVMNISDTITVLNFGRKIAEGTPRDVQSNPDVIKAYLGESTGVDTP
jgi:putative ABC transport system ATP-binding protein